MLLRNYIYNSTAFKCEQIQKEEKNKSNNFTITNFCYSINSNKNVNEKCWAAFVWIYKSIYACISLYISNDFTLLLRYTFQINNLISAHKKRVISLRK